MIGYTILALTIFCYMNIWFLVSLRSKRNDVADTAWGLGFVLLAWSSFFIFRVYNPVAVLINVMVTVWGLRLSYHIHQRNRNRKEDKRYAEMMKDNASVLRSYLQVFILQGVLLYLISLPVIFINSNRNISFGATTMTGFIIWLFGLTFEAIADKQLADFIKDPGNKGRIMRDGLWRYSRHPNYFGEVVLWWGIFVIAASVSQGLFTMIGPLTITILIIFVSGIPLLEKRYEGRADYAEYARKTSIFIPMPPSKT
ncbi:MAG: DUF1295 domain-containing protein [Patescibacteria group bacterium]